MLAFSGISHAGFVDDFVEFSTSAGSLLYYTAYSLSGIAALV
jgi:hypothetical protein